ncbi:primosomal protein N' [Acidocella aminolytica]|uniref:Replication restart protein PriA n=1 Tax=Acidocella aminolytica 101 = DSM 11237 TaxID=1120923 RepID=A0A0D6PJ92_9PROT|nr:primosomal protein N' [Acidocella aminolytica]GAN80894.1 primosome assembly protein PriA [Acidocella aminolytica 101 = DSM 11237]GBQ41601.1 primosome assembly protein PriA [Acidocella aminolytica 101 = DSM 11237]SHF12078.1 replication restart DNA helicase PriA [Acidocella aminolytica 101 = DSM 11237]
MEPAPRTTRLSILLPYKFDMAFTYEAEAPLVPGTLVRVPLGRRTVVGAVWDDPPDQTVKTRPVMEVLAFPPLPESLRKFIDWVGHYTLAPRGDVLALTLKEKLLETPLKRAKTFVFGGADPMRPGPSLSVIQEKAASSLRESVGAETFSVTLLDGVTGSGKTEVYLEAVAEALRRKRQVLVLLPEIALSVQMLARFEARFGVRPAVWHSELTPAQRRETFRAVAQGRADVVVGARSALFLPFADLGLIVVDEEHETSFKQEDGVMYNARDMAVVRAKLCAAPVLLVSATPSLETAENAAQGRYRKLDLPTRHGGAALPRMEALDMRDAPPESGKFLSPLLVVAMRQTLARGEQAMLFLNRRGYAPLTLCRTCGHRLSCPNCSAWLVEHRASPRLSCHHCGYSMQRPLKCPFCEAEGSFVPIGPGVERIAEEVAELFPETETLVMASDVIEGPAQAAEAAAKISAREVGIIIGTQMVAKGWHFPHLTLVGVVDADLGLAGGDLRAGEHTVQMLHQVAGRAGRAEAPGRVLLQSYEPEHPVIQALLSGDLPAFLEQEAAIRRPGHWPPFGRLAALIVSAVDERLADQIARALARAAPRIQGVEVLGPAPAPIALLRGRHRRRLLLKTRRDIAVQPLLRAWLAQVAVPRQVKLDVDVDPISFM